MNKITTNIHGSNVVNSRAGIMIQEVKSGFSATDDHILPVYKRDTKRSLKVDTPETLAPVHIYNRTGPKLPERATFTPPPENNVEFSKALREYKMWLLTRVAGSKGVKANRTRIWWVHISHRCKTCQKIFHRVPHPNPSALY